MTLLFAFLIGLFAGLRSLTAAAAWAAHLGWLRFDRPLSLIGSVPSVAIFTLLAAIELVGDKLPKTPNRTSPMGLTTRIVTGALTGACVAATGAQAFVLSAMLGAVGAVAGAFGGLPHGRVAGESAGPAGHLRGPSRGFSSDRRLALGRFAILNF